MKKSNNLILIGLVIVLAIIPLITMKGAEFGGADGQAEGVIEEVDPDYEPWFEPFMEPASGEIESLLFALQAAIGAGIIGYGIGILKGKRDSQKGNKK